MDRSTRSFALVVALSVVAALPGPVAARAPGEPRLPDADAPRFATLDAAVRAGAVDNDAVDSLAGRGRADVFLVLDAAPVLARAAVAAGGGRGHERALAAHSKREFAALKRSLIGRFGGHIRLLEDFDHLGLAKVRITSAATLLAALNEPSIRSVRVPRARTTALAESLPLIDQPEAIAAGYDGAGTSIAILDTGLDYTQAAFGCTSPNVPAESCRVAYAADIAPPDASLDDSTRHGTNVAGVAGGVATAGKLIGLDVFDADGAWDDDVVRGVNWVVANQAAYNIRAANLSLGDGTYNNSACWYSLYAAAFASLRAVGVLPVVAAGNGAADAGTPFTSGVSEPACAPGAVSVGAVYDSAGPDQAWGSCTDTRVVADKITCFSQSGLTLGLLAPGAFITAAGETMGGTSQAAPHVAGAAAVLAGEEPGVAVAEVQQSLVTSGTPVTDARNGLVRRRLDVDAAVAAMLATPTALRFEIPLEPSYDYGWSYGGSLSRTGSNLHMISTAWTGSNAEVRYRRSTNNGALWTSGSGVRLSSSNQYADFASTAAAGSTVHAVWTRFTNPGSATAPRYLYYRRNTNNGSGSWSATRGLTSSGRVDGASIAASGSYVYIVYTDSGTGTIYFQRSSDQGATWGARVNVGTSTRSAALGRWAQPTVAAYGAHIGIAYLSNSSGTVVARVSSDRGSTWSSAVTLTSASTGGLESSAASSRVGFAWTQSSSVRYRSWKPTGWQPTRSLYTLGADRAHKASRDVGVGLVGTGGVGIAFAGCISSSCAGTKSGTGIDLMWRESTNDGSSWGAPRKIASGRDTDLRHINDAPDVEWASATVRHVAFNGWTNTDTGWSQMYMVTGRGPSQ